MAIVLRDLYLALIQAGASEETAAAASEELVRFRSFPSAIESKLSLSTYMIGFSTGLSIAALVILLIPA
jgi:hypothetical protein